MSSIRISTSDALSLCAQLHFFHRYFFFNDPPPPEIYTLSLHDALPIFAREAHGGGDHHEEAVIVARDHPRIGFVPPAPLPGEDRKSTRLNSSHQIISYAVFCLKKKKNTYASHLTPQHFGKYESRNTLSD